MSALYPIFEFENWAVIALGGIPNKAQVGDMGIDGRIFPIIAVPEKDTQSSDFMNVWYPTQVKQKDNTARPPQHRLPRSRHDPQRLHQRLFHLFRFFQ